MKIIDLSKPIQFNEKDPWFMQVKIKHKPHKLAQKMLSMLGLPEKLYPKNFTGWADDTIEEMGVHSTTHIDAPWHYSPTCDGKPAKTAEQIPLEWCIGKGVMIDMSHKKDFEEISVKDITDFIAEHNLTLEEGTIVLIRTGCDKFNGTEDFFAKGPGMSAEATEWLIDQGIKVMGIDAWGWDTPLPHQIATANKENNSEIFWKAHLVGQRKEYCHLEQLVNLGALPYSGFTVNVLPLKIVGASAAPVRAIAILD